MKTTRKFLTLVSLALALTLLLASCNLNLFPTQTEGTTPPATTNPPADTQIDISKIPESQGLAYTVLDDTTCSVYGIGTCRDTVVRIPETIDGYRVTTVSFVSDKLLGETTGQPFSRVTTLIIPKTVTSIGVIAYEGLTSIVVDSENPIYYSEGNCIIEKISKMLVAGCDGSVIPQNIISIRAQAFYLCTNLTSLSIPASVTSIEAPAFVECNKLSNVTVDSNNPIYDTEENCLIEKATKTVVMGWGDTITIPNDVKRIGMSAFALSTASKIVIGDSVTTIGDYAFFGSNTPTIVMGNNVTTIGKAAFQACMNLTNITIPDSVTSIAAGSVFVSCDNLTRVNIGINLPEGNIFTSDLYNLTDVTFRGTIDEWLSGNIWNRFPKTDEVNYIVHCTDGDLVGEGRYPVVQNPPEPTLPEETVPEEMPVPNPQLPEMLLS